MRQQGLFGLSDHLKRLSAYGDPLEVLAQVVKFEAFRSTPVAALDYSDGAKGGLPPYDPVTMFPQIYWVDGGPQLIAPMIADERAGGRPRKAAWGELVNAIPYFVRAGAAWRLLPHDLPPPRPRLRAAHRRRRNPHNDRRLCDLATPLDVSRRPSPNALSGGLAS